VEPAVGGAAAYYPQPAETDPKTDPTAKPKTSFKKRQSRMSQRILNPRAHELATTVVIPNELIHTLVDYPELAWAVKEDIANGLVPAAGAGARSLDTWRLHRYDEQDGGVLLGYPYIVTSAAAGTVYFATDWDEAWIAADRDLVTVDVSTESRFDTDETVVRAVMHHDFAVRRPEYFIHT